MCWCCELHKHINVDIIIIIITAITAIIITTITTIIITTITGTCQMYVTNFQ